MKRSHSIRSATEVIAAVPFELGFLPQNSLVMVAMTGRSMAFAARYDLPSADLATGLAHHIAAVVRGHPINGVILLGYGSAARVTPAVRLTATAARLSGVTVLDGLGVDGGRFWSVNCQDDNCCPRPCPPRNSPYAVAATVAGQVALPNREALVAQFDPVDGDQRARMIAATELAEQRLTDEFGLDPADDAQTREFRQDGRRAVRDAERRYRAGLRLNDLETAWLGVVLIDLKVRDYAWARTGVQDWRVALWTDVSRRVQPDYVPAAAALLSFAAWRRGSGVVARIAVERALAHDPAYRMALYMNEFLSIGASPDIVRNWPKIKPPTPMPPVFAPDDLGIAHEAAIEAQTRAEESARAKPQAAVDGAPRTEDTVVKGGPASDDEAARDEAHTTVRADVPLPARVRSGKAGRRGPNLRSRPREQLLGPQLGGLKARNDEHRRLRRRSI